MWVYQFEYQLTNWSGRVFASARAPAGTPLSTGCTEDPTPDPTVIEVRCDSSLGFVLPDDSRAVIGPGPGWSGEIGFNAKGIICSEFFVGGCREARNLFNVRAFDPEKGTLTIFVSDFDNMWEASFSPDGVGGSALGTFIGSGRWSFGSGGFWSVEVPFATATYAASGTLISRPQPVPAPTPVPLPAGLPLLAAGLAALALLRRRT